ncbi:MAG TPA: sulfurtransferase, partial [Chitinophagaceae bacterium]|nr:sulfurtransferase [Chitinophagaceae bacterium]
MGIFSAIFGNKQNGNLKTVIKEGAFLVDVRSEIEFSSGSVNGAVNIPLEK